MKYNKFKLNQFGGGDSTSTIRRVNKRSDILERFEDPSDLICQSEGLVMLREEKFAPIKPSVFMGPYLSDLLCHKAFSRTKFRVPQIDLSKYHNAYVLPHGFIVNQASLLSQDSFEEFTVRSDDAWYNDELSFNYAEDGQYCIPRAKASPFFVDGQSFDFNFADDMPVIDVEEPTLFLMAWHHNNVSHWFLDILCRAWGQSFIPEKKFKVVVPSPLFDFMKESLNYLGFSDEDIIEARKDRVYRFRTLYNISRLASQYNFVSEECISFYNYFKNRIPKFKQSDIKKIYVSRGDTNRRPCLNEKHLEERIQSLGFKIICTTPLTLKERIELFSGADIIAGPCGAGMFHNLFMKDNTALFSIGTPEMNKNSSAFTNIGTPKNQDSYIFCGHNKDKSNPTTDSWEIDVDICMDAITHAISAL